MRPLRRFRFSPLTRFKLLSFIGFIFFAVCISFILIYFDDIDSFMLTNKRFNEPGSEEKFGLRDLNIFILLSAFNALAFLLSFIQLLVSKPTSKKVLIPVVISTISAFALLIALDFCFEIRMTHVTPKEALTKTESTGKRGKPGGKGRFKTAYFVIYACMCVVFGFIYLAYKDYEEYLEDEREKREPRVIVISHIT